MKVEHDGAANGNFADRHFRAHSHSLSRELRCEHLLRFEQIEVPLDLHLRRFGCKDCKRCVPGAMVVELDVRLVGQLSVTERPLGEMAHPDKLDVRHVLLENGNQDIHT